MGTLIEWILVHFASVDGDGMPLPPPRGAQAPDGHGLPLPPPR